MRKITALTAAAPPTHDLEGSFHWIRRSLGCKRNYAAVLRHLDRCLDNLDSYRREFQFQKASALFFLERWDALWEHLARLEASYPHDPEVHYEVAAWYGAHGDWSRALAHVRKAETHLQPREQYHFREGLYLDKISFVFALRGRSAALRAAQRILAKYPRLPFVRSDVQALKDGTYRIPEAWAGRTTRSTRRHELPELSRAPLRRGSA
jgi:hypothetical protein